jgi:DNA-binding MarR family transcriptional regulator
MIREALPTLTPCHCGVLRQASRHVSLAYDAALAPVGLKTTQMSLLVAIDQAEGGTTLQDLAKALVMDRSTLGKNLRPLEREGLVSILKGAADARRRQVSLTTDGRARLGKAIPLWQQAQTRLENAFGTKATAVLRENLFTLTTTKLN